MQGWCIHVLWTLDTYVVPECLSGCPQTICTLQTLQGHPTLDCLQNAITTFCQQFKSTLNAESGAKSPKISGHSEPFVWTLMRNNLKYTSRKAGLACCTRISCVGWYVFNDSCRHGVHLGESKMNPAGIWCLCNVTLANCLLLKLFFLSSARVWWSGQWVFWASATKLTLTAYFWWNSVEGSEQT